jgi:hypothetical protein
VPTNNLASRLRSQKCSRAMTTTMMVWSTPTSFSRPHLPATAAAATHMLCVAIRAAFSGRGSIFLSQCYQRTGQ